MRIFWMRGLCVVLFLWVCSGLSFAEAKKDRAERSVFNQMGSQAKGEKGVKEITYDQFMKIRKSDEKYILLDVLSSDSYKNGHIEGAVSFPGTKINEKTASARLKKDDKIIVYCGGFQCGASTHAAATLITLGYNVLDYKGGLEDWQEKGHSLVK